MRDGSAPGVKLEQFVILSEAKDLLFLTWLRQHLEPR